MNDPVLSLQSPTATGERPGPIELTIYRDDGGWTPGPYVELTAGNTIELTERELAWIVEGGGVRALAKLREENLHRGIGDAA